MASIATGSNSPRIKTPNASVTSGVPTSTTQTRETSSTAATTGVAITPASRTPNKGLQASTVPAQRVEMNGFGGISLNSDGLAAVISSGVPGSTETQATIDQEGWTVRGFFDVKFQPAVGGVDVQIESHHAKPEEPDTYNGDDMSLFLQARVLDGGRERVITLATLLDGVMNTDKGPVCKRLFHVNYKDINTWLRSKNPNLTFVPGDPLAVFGRWKDKGHAWGGFCRGGYFDSPQPLGRNTAVDVRTKGTTVPPPAARSTEYLDKPIDITLNLPEDLIKKYDKVLTPGAKLVSRREHEQKFCPHNMEELTTAVKGLLDICQADPHTQEEWLLQAMGRDEGLSAEAGYDVSGWHLKTTDRYYAKNDEGQLKTGPDGLPVVAPMVDAYQDDVSSSNPFPVARHNMAIRFRDGEIKSGESVPCMGKLNMKTTRVVDPLTLTQTGLEFSLDTRYGVSSDPAALQQLAELLDTVGAPNSPLPELKKTDPNVSGATVQQEAVVNVANRYKFTLEHENGMELEVSMDFVHTGIVCRTVEPAQTKDMDQAGKYDHYAKLLARADGTVLVASSPTLKTGAEEKNHVVVQDGENLVMARLWIDADGTKHVTEHPCVRFPQVEVEMDHVQAVTTGPAKAAYTSPESTLILADDAQQDEFLQSVGDHATMNGPPVIHALEDLMDPRLYQDHDYQQMQEAVVSFRNHVFPDGVLPARQKAAQALELAGLIPQEPLEIHASLPYLFDCDVQNYVVPSNTKPEVVIQGTKPIKLPVDAQLSINGFPVLVPLKPGDTAKDLAHKMAEQVNRSDLFNAVVRDVFFPGYTSTVYHVNIMGKA